MLAMPRKPKASAAFVFLRLRRADGEKFYRKNKMEADEVLSRG